MTTPEPATPAEPAQREPAKREAVKPAGSRWGLWIAGIVTGLLAIGALIAFGTSLLPTIRESPSDPIDERVARDADQRATVAELARAADAQSICYGWSIAGSAPNSTGSNRGVNVPVDSAPTACPKWLSLVATVNWTDESSEEEDSASVLLDGSPELLARMPAGNPMARLGITESALIDDPDSAVLRGVLVLPLLVAESGLADPVPRATVTGEAPDATELPATDGDFWRDRGGLVAFGLAVLAAASATVWIGLLVHRNELRATQRHRPDTRTGNRPDTRTRNRPGNRTRKSR